MTWTSVRLTKQEQAMLIKAAALEKVSVEDDRITNIKQSNSGDDFGRGDNRETIAIS
jgi:hypothetical protein